MMMRSPLLSLVTLLFLLPFWAQAQIVTSSTPPTAGPKYVVGEDYLVIDQPVRTRYKDKVEVVEVFWYGCVHCYKFQPQVRNWKKGIPHYVDFHRSPAIWKGNKTMKTHARAFYTAEALGVSDKLDVPLFTTLVVERKGLNTEDDLADLFVDYGVDRDDFHKAYTSFTVSSQANKAEALTRSYKIRGTPEMVVNGKYRVPAGNRAFEVVNFLIEKERAAMTLDKGGQVNDTAKS